MTLINDVIYGGNSLLYNVDYDAMSRVLNPNRKKIQSQGIKSVRQRVAGLSEYLDEQYKNLDIFEFKDLIIKRLFNTDDLSSIKRYEISDQDWMQIDELIEKNIKTEIEHTESVLVMSTTVMPAYQLAQLIFH